MKEMSYKIERVLSWTGSKGDKLSLQLQALTPELFSPLGFNVRKNLVISSERLKQEADHWKSVAGGKDQTAFRWYF